MTKKARRDQPTHRQTYELTNQLTDRPTNRRTERVIESRTRDQKTRIHHYSKKEYISNIPMFQIMIDSHTIICII